MSKPELDDLQQAYLNLDNQLCFHLYTASRKITQAYRPYLQQLGLTYPQYLVMLVLWKTDGINVSELGQQLYLDSGTLTPLLKRMEQQGLLDRKRSNLDERVVEIHLSEQGWQLQQEAVCLPEAFLGELDTPVTELLQLKEQLSGLIKKLDKTPA